MEVVKGYRFVEERAPLDGLSLCIVDNSTIPHSYLEYSFSNPYRNVNLTLTLYNYYLGYSGSSLSLWSIVFMLENSISGRSGYLVLGYYSRYGLRIEVYVDNELVYISSWFHPRFNKYLNKTITLSITYSSGALSIVYNGVYWKTANLPVILENYGVSSLYIHGVSSSSSVSETLIDNIVIECDSETQALIDFENHTIEPLIYIEVGDNDNPYNGTQYIYFTSPTIVSENTFILIAIVIAVILLYMVYYRVRY